MACGHISIYRCKDKDQSLVDSYWFVCWCAFVAISFSMRFPRIYSFFFFSISMLPIIAPCFFSSFLFFLQSAKGLIIHLVGCKAFRPLVFVWRFKKKKPKHLPLAPQPPKHSCSFLCRDPQGAIWVQSRTCVTDSTDSTQLYLCWALPLNFSWKWCFFGQAPTRRPFN